MVLVKEKRARKAITQATREHTERLASRIGPPLSLSRFDADADVQVNPDRDTVVNRVESRQSQEMMPPELDLRSSSDLGRPYAVPIPVEPSSFTPLPSVNAGFTPPLTLDSSETSASTIFMPAPLSVSGPLVSMQQQTRPTLMNHEPSTP